MSREIRMVMIGMMVLMCGTLLMSVSIAADEHEHSDYPPPSPLLARISALAGDWEGTSTEQHEGMPEKITVNYRVTGGGSAVVEALFPGTEHEMVTIYYVDAGKLVLTHYCMLGNQPMMTAENPDAPNNIRFVCHGGGNIPDENVPHMHEVTHKFIDPYHLQSTWVFYSEGKPSQTSVFDFQRVQR